MAERTTSRLGSSVLDLTVDDRAFNKGIKGVVNHTKHLHSAFDTAGVKAEKLSGRIHGLSNSFKVLAGVGGIGGALFALVRWTEAMVNNIVEMKVLSATAGVSAQAFQEYSYGARQAGLSQSGLIDGLKELKLRVDEFAITGYGPGADAFRRLGYSMDDFNNGLITTDDMLASVIEAIRRVPSQEARLRIADEILGGTGGEQFERLIRYLDEIDGSMQGTRQRAHELGIVLGDDLVDNTRRLHIRFLELKDVISTKLARALLGILPTAEELDEWLEERIPRAINAIIGWFNKLVDAVERLKPVLQVVVDNLNLILTAWAALKGAKMLSALGPWGKATGAVVAGGGMAIGAPQLTGQQWEVPPFLGPPGEKTWRELEASGNAAGEALDETAKAAENVTKKFGEVYVPELPPEPVNQGSILMNTLIPSMVRIFHNEMSDFSRMYLTGAGEPVMTRFAPGEDFDVEKRLKTLVASYGLERQLDIAKILFNQFIESIIQAQAQQRAAAGIPAPGLEGSLFNVYGTPAFQQGIAGYQTPEGQALAGVTGQYFDAGAAAAEPPPPPDVDWQNFIDSVQDASGVLDYIAEETGEGLLEAFGSAQAAADTLSEALGTGGLSLVALAVTEVLTGLWEVLGPAVDNIIKPLVRVLRALGRIVGTVLTPILTVLAVVVGAVEAAFVWFYNNILIHLANAFIGLANAIIWLINTVTLGLARLEYLAYLEPAEIRSREDLAEPPPSPGDEPGIPYELPGDRVGEDADGAGRPAQFRQQRPINVYITFPGNVYAVGEGGFREFAQLITEEQKRIGALNQ